MPVLELAIDATGMQRGQQQAESALKGVQDAATKTQASVTAMGGSLRNTFQVVGGVSQVGQGIAQAASAFSSLNLTAGAFASSRVLLEISKTTQDFREMALATTGATSAWSVLGTVIRTHPILTLATVLGAAAGLMALFSSNTKQAASSVDTLAASMQKIRLDEQTRMFLGARPRGSEDELSHLFGVTSQLLREGPGTATQPRTYSLADVQQMVGARSLGGLATDLRVPTYDRTVPGFENFDLGAVRIPQEDVLNWVRGRYQRLSARPSQPGAGYDYSYQRQATFGLEGDMASGDRTTAAIEAARQMEEAMARSAEYARQIGGSLGAAVWDVAAGLQGWRQAVLSIINSVGRQTLSNLGASAASSLFGPTARQGGTTSSAPPGTGFDPWSGS